MCTDGFAVACPFNHLPSNVDPGIQPLPASFGGDGALDRVAIEDEIELHCRTLRLHHLEGQIPPAIEFSPADGLLFRFGRTGCAGYGLSRQPQIQIGTSSAFY